MPAERCESMCSSNESKIQIYQISSCEVKLITLSVGVFGMMGLFTLKASPLYPRGSPVRVTSASMPSYTAKPSGVMRLGRTLRDVSPLVQIVQTTGSEF